MKSVSGGKTSAPTPWITTDKVYHKGMLGLHEEIEDFFRWISPTPAERCMRGDLMHRIKKVISVKFPNAVVDYFGSYRTGLYLPSSDIDIVLLGEWSHFPLHSVKEELVKAGTCSHESVKVLDRASVPIIKLTDQLTDVKIDVSFNMVSGLNTAKLVKSFIDRYPCLQKLVLVLKQFLQQHGLNESFTGGIGSYALVLLTVSFLQLHPEYDQTDEEVNLGVLLVEFFELYGRNFNFVDTAIRIKDGGCYICKEEMFCNISAAPAAQRTPAFSIEDPLQAGNDVGRTSYAAPQVKQAFESAYYQLYAATIEPKFCASDATKSCSNTSILGKIIQISDELYNYRERATIEYTRLISARQRTYSHVIMSPPRRFKPKHILSCTGSPTFENFPKNRVHSSDHLTIATTSYKRNQPWETIGIANNPKSQLKCKPMEKRPLLQAILEPTVIPQIQDQTLVPNRNSGIEKEKEMTVPVENAVNLCRSPVILPAPYPVSDTSITTSFPLGISGVIPLNHSCYPTIPLSSPLHSVTMPTEFKGHFKGFLASASFLTLELLAKVSSYFESALFVVPQNDDQPDQQASVESIINLQTPPAPPILIAPEQPKPTEKIFPNTSYTNARLPHRQRNYSSINRHNGGWDAINGDYYYGGGKYEKTRWLSQSQHDALIYPPPTSDRLP